MNSKDILSHLLDDIESRRFPADGKLPSDAQLCVRFAASRMTVRRALEQLQIRRLIEKRNGVGSFLTRRAQRKSGIIGLVIPDYGEFSFFKDLTNEFERLCKRLNYRVELVTTADAKRKNAIADIRHKIRRLAVIRPEGVVFRPYLSLGETKANREIVRILKNAEIPVVLIDSDITPPPERSECDLVAVDNISAGRRIADYLHGAGYRRIAFFARRDALQSNSNWSNRLFGLAGELALIGDSDGFRQYSTARYDPKTVSRILSGRNRPDAIVCGNDETAIALLNTIHALGLRVPDDVAIVGFDDSNESRSANPPLTTVSQPVGKLAATAFKTLLARVSYPHNDPREIHLTAPLVIRQST